MVLLGKKEYKALLSQIDSSSRLNSLASILASFRNQSPTWNKIDPVDKYCTNGDIYSVIKKIAEAVSVIIPSYLFYQKPDQQKSMRELKSITTAKYFSVRNLINIKLLQRKALEDAKEDDPVQALLDKPNPHQNGSEFEEAIASYYLATGEAIIWKNKLKEGANEGTPYELFCWNPNDVKITFKKIFPEEIDTYELWLYGQRVVNAQPEDIIHIKTFNPNNPFRGLSPLNVGYRIVNRLETNEDRTSAQLSNGNLPGVIYDKTIPYEEGMQATLDAKRKHIYDFMTDPKNANAPYYSAGELGFLKTGLKLTDLEAVELGDIDFGRLCNLWGISARLFNRKGDSTRDNQVTDSKNAFLYCYLPLKYKIRNALNSGLLPDFPDDKTKNRYIEVDVSNIPELQNDMEKQVQAMWGNGPGGFTLNEHRALFKYDDRPEPYMDVPVIKSGYSFFDDVNIPPVDPDLLNT